MARKKPWRQQGFRALLARKPHSGTWAFILKQREATEQFPVGGIWRDQV